MLRRFRNFQPIADVSRRDDDKYTGGRLGFITYDESDNYQMTYLEVGLRSDHLAQAVGSITASPIDRSKQHASTPHDYDSHLVREADVAELTELKAVA